MDDASGSHRYRRPVVLAIALLVVLATGVAAWLFYPGDPPVFPEGRAFRLELPELTVPSAKSWGFEDRAMMFAVKDGRVEVRTNYAPPDGGPAVRLLREDHDASDLPWPEGDDAWGVAAVVAAGPEETWFQVGVMPFRGVEPFQLRSVYLAGRAADGSLTALALYAERSRRILEMGLKLGTCLTPGDLTEGGPLLELEIRRLDDGIRYRWGHDPFFSNRGPWDGGEVIRLVEVGFVSDERSAPQGTAYVNVLDEGRMIISRREYSSEELARFLDDRMRTGIVLRADERVSWVACRIVVRATRSRGLSLLVDYAPVPGLPYEQVLDLPLPADETTVIEADIETAPDGSLRVVRPHPLEKGMAIRFHVPDGATAGPVLRLVAELRAVGILVDPD